jgi:hypothetical protein
MNLRERKLVKGLRRTLASKFQRIETHRIPAFSPKVKRCLESVLGYVPILQPELDMILWRESGTMVVEVKVSTPSNMRSFYEGIGQALALHRFGFDYASLWLLFLDATPDDLRRGATAWEFIRNRFRLHLDFTYFQVETIDGDLDNCKFYPMQYLGSQEGYRLLDIGAPNFNIRPKWQNPIRNLYEQRAIRYALELWFDDVLTVGRLKGKLQPYSKPTPMDSPLTAGKVLPTTETSSDAELQAIVYGPSE